MIDFTRRTFLFGLSTVIAVLSLGVGNVEAAWPTLKKGDVLVTRNPFINLSPGYWNHVAIYDGNGSIIEAHTSGYQVRKTALATFYNNYPQIRVYRLNAQYLIPRMVDRANQLIGQPYSLFVGQGQYSCIALVRFSYYYATLAYVQGGEDPGWLVPDSITTDRRFIFVGQK